MKPAPQSFGTVLGIAPGGVAAYSSDYYSVDPQQLPDRHSFRNYVQGVYTGYKWQCVEFARRWLLQCKGYVFDDIAMAYDIFRLKHVRVLADEQNEVLHALRRKEPVRELTSMLASEREQAERYGSAIAGELTAAAVAGATSMGMDTSAATREVKSARAIAGATDVLVTDVVQPLRERLTRCVGDADGDNTELASLVRLVYREWKNQRIDEHLDDVARTAFGRGALAGVAPGTAIRWVVDPAGPACADAEDNALGGAVPAGECFPTDHRCAPAHNGCRCIIAPAD